MKTGKRRKTTESVTLGTDNIFADLGLPDADERLAKAQIAHVISTIIRKQKLTQSKAADLLGLDQPKVSALLSGKLAGFSMERLFQFLTRLGRNVEIKIARARNNARLKVLTAADR
jgi:predicted XRE-type DNA-binding protein